MFINSKTYLFELSYGERTGEIEFISDILNNFDNNTLMGINLLVNNNVYNLEFLLLLFFEKDSEKFDNWLSKTYPNKKNNFIFNYSTDEIFNQLRERRYNAFGFSTIDELKLVITENPNSIFLFPTIKKIEEIWGKASNRKTPHIFLSHSSADKIVVEDLFLELQKEELKVWFDKYEINLGDSISDKINEGLNNSTFGIICLSKNFLLSNWAKSEMNYFIQQRANKGKPNFICLVLDLEHSEIPPLLQEYRYISLKDPNWISQLIDGIKKKSYA